MIDIFFRQTIMCSANVLREFLSVRLLRKVIAILQTIWLFYYTMRSMQTNEMEY